VGMVYTCLKYFEKGLMAPRSIYPGHAGSFVTTQIPPVSQKSSHGFHWSIIRIGPGSCHSVMGMAMGHVVGARQHLLLREDWPKVMPNWWKEW
jgi:hypothetical protein